MHYLKTGALLFSVALLAACATQNENMVAGNMVDSEPVLECKFQAPTGSRIKRNVCREPEPTPMESRDRLFRLHELPMSKGEIQ